MISEPQKTPSDRSFGFTLGLISLAISLVPLLHKKPLRIIPLGISVALLLAAALKPESLHVLNRLWMKLGELLGAVVTPLVFGIFYILFFTPVAWLQRRFGRPVFRIKPDPNTATYWTKVDRHENFKEQF